MVVDPVSTTLAVAGVLQPAFAACRKSYKVYKSMQSFGDDFDIARRKLELQIVRLEACSTKKLGFLMNNMNPYDENDENTQKVITQPAIIQRHFDVCNKISEKYQRRQCHH